LYAKVSTNLTGEPVFETFAVVSTIGCVVIFVALYQANRSSDQQDKGN
jgi:hypothetical protein